MLMHVSDCRNGTFHACEVHATCLFIGQLKETVQEMVPYPIAGHVQETCDFPEEGIFQDLLQDM